MKLTLFTISNEQIKESLDKLQTKVESWETVKEVQDKIIATKDSQISFLNDQIANILSFIGIITSAVIFVFGYVAWLNKQAQNKVKQAESLISQNQETATIAQGKLDELEEKRIELKEIAAALSKNQRMDISLKNINIELGFIDKSIVTLLFVIKKIFKDEQTEVNERYNSFKAKYIRLKKTYTDLSLIFYTKIIKGKVIDQQDEDKINKLENECLTLRQGINDYSENFQEND